jgi:hypothetical protein
MKVQLWLRQFVTITNATYHHLALYVYAHRSKMTRTCSLVSPFYRFRIHRLSSSPGPPGTTMHTSRSYALAVMLPNRLAPRIILAAISSSAVLSFILIAAIRTKTLESLPTRGFYHNTPATAQHCSIIVQPQLHIEEPVSDPVWAIRNRTLGVSSLSTRIVET